MRHFLLIFAVALSQHVLAANKKPQTQHEIIDDAGRKELNKRKGYIPTKTDWESVKILKFSNTFIDDRGLGILAVKKELSQLEKLYLAGTKISDAGLLHVAQLQQLKLLSLRECQNITDEGLKALYGCKNLQMLKLGKTRVSDAAITELKKKLGGCTVQKKD